MATADDDLIWLPLPEAAARLAKSTDAVRSMIRRDKLVTRKGNDGGVLVGVPLTVGDGQATAGDRAADGRATAELLRATVDELRAEVTELRERLARAEADRDRAREMAEAQVAAARAVAEERVKAAEAVAVADVATARAEVEAKEQVVAEVRRSLEHERARADRIEADARRPWWGRFLGR